MFHQSILYFRPGKPAIIRKLTDDRANQWRMERRPFRIPSDRATGTVSRQESFSSGDVAEPRAEAQAHSAKDDRASKSASDFGHNVFRGVDPTGRSLHSITLSSNSNKADTSTLRLPFQQGVRTPDNSPMRQSEPVSGTDLKPYPRSSINLQARANASDLVTPRIRQPESHTAFHASVATTALPTPAPVRTIHERSVSKMTAHRDASPERAFTPFDVDRVRHNDADVPKVTTAFGGRAPEVTGDTPARSDTHFLPVAAKATAPMPGHGRTDGVSLRSKDFDFGEHGSAHQPGSLTVADQSSNLVGELWLDTLSLREWLQAYLAGEMGHALQATNRFGTSFE